MSYIYKIDRIELYEQIKKYGKHIHGRVLDVGAGNFSRYRGLFNYTEYVKMNIDPGGNTDIVGVIENIPVSDNSFDAVVCTQVLGDVYELQKAFSELSRVLRPGGTLLVTENLFDSLHDQPHDFWRFTEHSLRRLAQESGFEVTILDRRGGYRSIVAQMRERYWIERLHAHKKWYARLLSKLFKIQGEVARFMDHRDHSAANKIFTQGYILIARKHG